MKEQGQQRVNGDERYVAGLPPSVKSKAPIWSAEQTYLRRSIEHKINLGDINLKRTLLTTAVKVFNERQSQKNEPGLPQPILLVRKYEYPRVSAESQTFFGAAQPPDGPSEQRRLLREERTIQERSRVGGRMRRCVCPLAHLLFPLLFPACVTWH